ncbi:MULTISPECIES: 23S rRNA (adenine(2503)-C(2))-methyltransferase RlmN [Heyndrickxia]|jgi:23S rRNA (adenine2503-C2)-methyltransferase|uniref:Probable dual-specificity RNA methyltransferase RlmN n=1 Tax=Heyndrickxia oleronia TaxID=38875 RepID=A0A8E2LF86_9BACI|nr:23S rRNA (adenine(2503)-C(2))-methyltransferase RlmN [Heyndrickxia oleronia]NYV63672.1 23S rRNA (adenine(2503)-C(2))-methyltransferase RlmN [Bacillus sp. Gen3]OJH18349.1 23S rRNA (adenine(2503)-C(2))-methyltransferase RlmN [Bacillus obstructivus]MBU5213349.1 23S rRNA (adenine(2503)-C(2))-methyltransferase RlmN [Heyndrickxia oleronia]MCI1589997.1 23S rRNA (adenine(2503)-C(2))-methyltransferase RlmN [Heyndrickxia oleronia]MCI1613377.1 23S rRNA (adenine(2503)-C(2))-methyltransferase RlmN [Heyn
MTKESIYGLTIDQLTDWFLEHGQKKFRAQQVWEWLYKKRVKSFSEMSNINKDCIQLLEEHFNMHTLQLEIKQESKDGTVKFLFKLPDGNLIETVLMRQKYGLSVCVTTQVGCNIGCSFCASGILRKNRDLTSGEIVEQIMNVQLHLDEIGKDERVSHVVVMGIGEPFDNFTNLVTFLKNINSPKGLAIGARHITVSTSGLAPKIYEFADLDLQVNLAISLHAPNNELRTQIMKINRAYPLEKLMPAIDYYLEKTNRRITFEYILLNDVNDHKEEALQLAKLLQNKRHLAYVNLIPYNPVSEHIQYKRSTQESIMTFYDTLKKNGINCVVRQEHGTDIDAACGQLRSKQLKKAN